ncbi:hypothetical protein CLOSTMETH_03547 [[Clostridium] methylpentosum DSM 5476]|uniref:Uncharacterized protein n=1 Tax=[Clostridium] methylpentosum DSM 5476 TaxID=537013 RepID=C0EI52_9FIRM|nr:hypothetical protein CLOSTMETH_03547 [[Clostridium] methylpentosum DSM 5476]
MAAFAVPERERLHQTRQFITNQSATKFTVKSSATADGQRRFWL